MPYVGNKFPNVYFISAIQASASSCTGGKGLHYNNALHVVVAVWYDMALKLFDPPCPISLPQEAVGRAVVDLAVGGFVFLSGYCNFMKFCCTKEMISVKTAMQVIAS